MRSIDHVPFYRKKVRARAFGDEAAAIDERGIVTPLRSGVAIGKITLQHVERFCVRIETLVIRNGKIHAVAIHFFVGEKRIKTKNGEKCLFFCRRANQ